MNIHEHQAKEIFKKFKIPVPNGVVIFDPKEIAKKIKKLKTGNFVVKAQIHAGGRGKAGGIKIVKNSKNLLNEAKKMFKKKLVTHQTGPSGKKVKRLYIEETCSILKEFYLSSFPPHIYQLWKEYSLLPRHWLYETKLKNHYLLVHLC